MEDIIMRNRYPRQSVQYRRRTRKVRRLKNERKSVNIIRKIILQTTLCILLVVFAAIIKGVDSPVTNYFERKIISALTYNMDIKGFFHKMDAFIQNTDNENILSTNEEKPEDLVEIAASDDKMEIVAVNDDYINSFEKNNGDGGEFLEEKMVDSISYNADDEHSFIIPVGGTISCFFGEKKDSSGGDEIYHKGINIEAETGTPIRAAYSGEVLEVGEDMKMGKFIEIKHKNDVKIIYSNCSELLAEKGQYISKGDIIAKVGNSANYKNPSLYMVMLKDDVPVNPLDYIDVFAEQDI